MTPNFRPRFMSATHVPSSTERLMNPFYHSQLRLPPYRARYLQRFHPYPRDQGSGWARDAGDSDFEWDDFLEARLFIHGVNMGLGRGLFAMPLQTQRLIFTSSQMVDAFQRLDINSVARPNNVYAFPAHAATEEQVELRQHDGHRAADSSTASLVSAGVETQTIDAVAPHRRSDSNRVLGVEDSDIVTPTGEEDNQGDRLDVSIILFIPASP
ncbi:hypothetical protein PLEOSDRAFT_155197 [Pleurotus ostreatus PC15]|uniref:Uncharacterized protein n=1 Tax=Pleurotus ostreatus (strain PC15) TaxID=1137138 RepID=A0A067NR15_PLEO1|nr:hypothetical protein PLEOSDRAFT_155197 [Pleurotus ostreatus PC15]